MKKEKILAFLKALPDYLRKLYAIIKFAKSLR